MLPLLKAFRSDDVEQFKSSIPDMDFKYGLQRRRGLLSHLATVALETKNGVMLKAVLDVHGAEVIQWQFHWHFDKMKHDGSEPEIVRVIEESQFVSMVPPGKAFLDMHPLDWM